MAFRRQRNTSCIYTGRVGARMKQPAHRLRVRRITRKPVRCDDGPLKGHRLWLDAHGGQTTLPFRLGNDVGHYVCGKWVSLFLA